ncbi:MAG: hypothetical protein ABI823_00035 [Bryobacteraceae bacterium]
MNTFFEERVDQLVDSAKRVADAFEKAGIPYQIIGGLATYIHVDTRSPIDARLTRDVDVAVRRADLDRIRKAVEAFGFKYRHIAGVDMLVDAKDPKARSAIHLVFAAEKVRPEYLEPIPEIRAPFRSAQGLCIAPIADLVTMKLTSFRLKDQVHVQDLDGVGLITPEVEAVLSPELKARLAQVRASS